MRVLIVDDSPTKIRRLVRYLTETSGLDRDDVVVAHSALNGRRALRDEQFDVLILDIALPLRPEDEPLAETSLELLEEIIERDTYYRPRQIIGTTAYGDLADRAEPHFSDRLWTVVRFDETSDEWLDRIGGCIDYLKRQTAEPTPSINYMTDVCIITALTEPEMQAIHRLDWSWQPTAPLDDSTFVRRGRFESGHGRYSVVTASAPRMGMVSTALLASKLIQHCRPRFLIMAGICAGVQGKANLGDVILADPSWDWQSGKRIRVDDKPGFDIAPHQLGVSTFIRSRAEQLRGDQEFWDSVRRDFTGAPGTPLRFAVGPVASGSAVLADGQLVMEIRGQRRDLVAVEMEIYGLYAAAEAAPIPRPTAFAMKGVCDFGDANKSDAYQLYAAYTSARAVQAFCERYMHEIAPMAGR